MCAFLEPRHHVNGWRSLTGRLRRRADAARLTRSRLVARLVRPGPPRLALGIAVAAVLIAAETLLVYPLQRFATPGSVTVVYLLGVLLVSTVWGRRLGALMSVAGAAAYTFFHIRPLRHFTPTYGRDWVELTAFLVAALAIILFARRARTRAVEAVESRRAADISRREADLSADLAHLMLRTYDLSMALPEASRRLAEALDLPFAEIEPATVARDERRAAFPLRYRAPLGTLLVPADLPEPMMQRLRNRVVPTLETLLRAAYDREAVGRYLTASRDELRVLAEEQTALRRVATLVAHGVSPADVFTAVVTEATRLLNADAARLMRYDPEGVATVVAENGRAAAGALVGRRFIVDRAVAEAGFRIGHEPCAGTDEDRPGSVAAWVRELGFRSSVGAPILVEGRFWGLIVVSSSRPEPPPPDAEERLAQFSELVATAIANADNSAELNASRARIVMAADQARRRIERDLHDGAQQRLVSLGLQLRAVEESLPPDRDGLRAELSRLSQGLRDVSDNLQEISRGLHPAILTQGGLRPALSALVRRCPVPVRLDLDAPRRLPERVEVAAYYVVSEALTNTAKHAQASEVCVKVQVVGNALMLTIRDDGVGGADPDRGSGLTGLRDRVEALGGQMKVVSPLGGGTSLFLELPIGADDDQWPDGRPLPGTRP